MDMLYLTKENIKTREQHSGRGDVSVGHNFLNSIMFWDITPCSPLKVNRRFGETYRLHLQGKINRARYQRESR
jgi:hypothetical protein